MRTCIPPSLQLSVGQRRPCAWTFPAEKPTQKPGYIKPVKETGLILKCCMHRTFTLVHRSQTLKLSYIKLEIPAEALSFYHSKIYKIAFVKSSLWHLICSESKYYSHLKANTQTDKQYHSSAWPQLELISKAGFKLCDYSSLLKLLLVTLYEMSPINSWLNSKTDCALKYVLHVRLFNADPLTRGLLLIVNK